DRLDRVHVDYARTDAPFSQEGGGPDGETHHAPARDERDIPPFAHDDGLSHPEPVLWLTGEGLLPLEPYVDGLLLSDRDPYGLPHFVFVRGHHDPHEGERPAQGDVLQAVMSGSPRPSEYPTER